MDEILKKLGLLNSLIFDELPNCSICNLDKDKILIICDINELEEIDYIVNRLPSQRKRIMQDINNVKNIELVQKERIPMSKFLWDMYVIALHKIDDHGKIFKAADISEYERNRFIARKIVIQYENLTELEQKFNELIFPERILDGFSTFEMEENDEVVDFTEIKKLLEEIDTIILEEE